MNTLIATCDNKERDEALTVIEIELTKVREKEWLAGHASKSVRERGT